MSAQQNTYLIYGVMFAYDLFTEEALESLEQYRDSAYDKPRGFTELTVLVDGMNGEYVIMGFVLGRSDEFGLLEDILLTPHLSEDVQARMLEKLWDACPIPEQQDAACWMALTHYR